MKVNKKIIINLLLTCAIVTTGSTVDAKKVLPEKVVLNTTKQTIYTKQSRKLKVVSVKPAKASKAVSWKSSNKKIVTVNKKGVIKGIKKGTAKIMAFSGGKKRASCKVLVKKFKEKKISSKITMTSLQTKKLLNNLGIEYKIIRSFSELKKIQKQIKKIDKGACYQKLSSYKKSYFKRKALLIMEGYTGNLSVTVSARDVVLCQRRNGKVIAQLQVEHTNANTIGESVIQMLAYQQYFVEVSKADADLLDGCSIKVSK